MSSPPIKYTRKGNFTANQQGNPALPPSATLLDQEYNALKATTDQTISRLGEIQRDDGEVANISIGRDQLKAEIVMGVNTPVDWTPFTDYTVRDSVIVNNGWWWCEVAHTSGATWDATEQAYWQIIANWQAAADAADASAAAAAASAANAHTSEVNAANSAASVGNSAANAAASATASANSATASAGSATASAGSATASAGSANAAATSAGNAHTSEVNAAASAAAAAESAADAVGGAADADNINSGTLSAQFIDYDTLRLTAVGTKLKALGPTTSFNNQAAAVNAALDGAMNYNGGASTTPEWDLPTATPGMVLGFLLTATAGGATTIRPAAGDIIAGPGAGHVYTNAAPLIIPATPLGSLATIFLVARTTAWDILSVASEIANAMGWISRPYFSATFAGASVGIAANTTTKCIMDSVQQDNFGWWDATNHRYTPKRPGKYLAHYEAQIGDTTTGATQVLAFVLFNGGGYGSRILSWNGVNFLPFQIALAVSAIVPCNGATDYIEPAVLISGTSSPTIFGGSVNALMINYLGP